MTSANSPLLRTPGSFSRWRRRAEAGLASKSSKIPGVGTRVKKLALGEVALAFGAGALGKVECGKSECGWHGGDAFGRASTIRIGAADASNVRSDSLEGSLWGSLRRREPR